MKKLFLFMGVVAAVAWGGGSTVGAAPGGLPGELAACQSQLQVCTDDLAALRGSAARPRGTDRDYPMCWHHGSPGE